MHYIKFSTREEAERVAKRVFEEAEKLGLFSSGTTAYAIPTKTEFWEIPILPGFESLFLESEFKKSEAIEHGYHSITPTQGRILLKRMGLLDQVNAMVEGSGDEALQIYWEYSLSWDRHNPYIASMANLLGMSEADLDNFYLQASSI